MPLPNELKGKSKDEIEEWFLAGVEAEPLPLDAMFAVLESEESSDDGDQVEGWAELLQDALAGSDNAAAALRLLKLRCQWSGDSPAFSSVCRKTAREAFSSRMGKAFVKNVGFEGDVAPSESLRRLEVLSKLEKGTLCYEKTWGFGAVKRVDDFYERVTIDFATKANHEMSMAYAAETLELISDDHLLARLHRDADGLRAMVSDDAAEVVRITLRSYGPMSAPDLKDRLVDAVLSEGEWKTFWDNARKGLKKDPLVHLPAKRTEPIVLLDSPDDLVGSKFQELAEVRDPEGILTKASQLEADGLLKGLTPENAAILGDRLAFAIWGAEGKHPDLVARALLMAVRMGAVGEDGTFGERGVNALEVLSGLLAPETLFGALTKLPVRAMSGLLEYGATALPDQMASALIPLLPRLSVSVITEAIPRLREVGHESQLAESVKSLVSAREATPSMLVWVFKHLDTAREWVQDDPAELLRQGFDAVEWPEAGDQLRAQHQLRALFESDNWLTDRMHALSHEQRVVLLNRVHSCRGWDEAGRRSVVANIIKVYPELHESLTVTESDEEKPQVRLTSWRAFRERQMQLKKLMEEEIPANSREIAVARSYGDLRENAEFKYAKEHQRILYRRRDEMEEDLKMVKGTDFAGCGTESVGMGTIVTIRRPDDSKDRYCILGEWDRDEGLNIISSLSRLAQLLEGHRVGDRVNLPAAVGEEQCEVVALEGLSDEVVAWLAG